MIIKYVCDDHIDDAMDDIINEYETFPLIERCEDKQCEYCKKVSTYKVRTT